tara:strand:+ start:326 stop:1480 length:1155 start_codon:yes stop_codon:yes gene_type:complete
VVFPTTLSDNIEQLERAETNLKRMITESPELRGDTNTPVLGGFSAFGHPSSFHHTFAREAREIMLYEALSNDVLPIINEDGTMRHVETCYDRVLVRRADHVVTTAEPVHRDEAPMARAGDIVLGGWQNLNKREQFFHCCPGTHTEVGGSNSGYAPIVDPTMKAHYKSLLVKVCIPKGHMLVFYERIVHAVFNSGVQPDPTMRVFCGFRLTDNKSPLFGTETTMKWIDEQAVPRIKSGQWPAVYPSAYSNFPAKHATYLADWSRETFVDKCLVEHTITSKSQKPETAQWNGHKTRRVKAHMRSLKEYGLPLHREYTESEKAVLFPSKSWSCLHTGNQNEDGESETVHMSLPTDEDMRLYRLACLVAPRGCCVKRPRPFEVDESCD